MPRILKLLLICWVLLCLGFDWGFFAHKQINRLAVFTLPSEMIGFYKRNIEYLSEASVAPDRRRYAVKEEGPRHYIDLDKFGDSALFKIPHQWGEAVEKFGEDTLLARGIVPWQIVWVYAQLKEAFMLNDPNKILKMSAELGHYVSDANVPLHTTSNYDGQLTGQTGLHGFWESRLPELFFEEYEFLVGKAAYTENVSSYAWHAVMNANEALDSVLLLDTQLYKKQSNKKYGFETRGKQTVKVVSYAYAKDYHQLLNGMVERQMRVSVKMIGDLWYSAWVDAGQPDLKKMIDYIPTEEELKKRKEELENWKLKKYQSREHKTDGNN